MAAPETFETVANLARRAGDRARYVPPAPTARLGLQRRAASTLRRHLARAAGRVSVLLLADLTAFAILRELYRLVGEGELLGQWIGTTVQRLLPAGYLDGWQYAVALVLGLSVTGNYGVGDRRRDVVRLLSGCALATALPLWAPLWELGLGLGFTQFALTTIVVWLGLIVARAGIDAFDAALARQRPRAAASSRTILIGSPGECAELASRAAFAAHSGHVILGYADTGHTTSPSAMGALGALPTLIQQHRVESVVICGSLSDLELRDVVDQAITAGCNLFSNPRTFALAGVQPRIVWKRGQPLVELSAQTLKAQQFAIKRVVDVIGAALGAMVLAPVLLAVAAVIKLESRGPVLFRQRRTGLGGQPFMILKFRTMADGADALKDGLTPLSSSQDPRIFKMANDPRVSRIGRFLRRWGLDELPQLWNVLVGDMSLVGPRPFVETNFDVYQAHHFSRLGAKPGITGLWQVRRKSDTVDFEEIIALDAEYIREWSLLLDLKILLLTPPAVIRGNGAV